MIKLLKPGSVVLPFTATHIFLFFLITSSLFNFCLSQNHLNNPIIIGLNFVHLSFSSIIVTILVKEKWKYKVKHSSPLWLSIFTIKLLIIPMFEVIMSDYSASLVIHAFLGIILFTIIVERRFFSSCLMTAAFISVAIAMLLTDTAEPSLLEEYKIFLVDDLFVILSLLTEIFVILCLLYSKQIELEIKINSMKAFSNVVAHEIFTPLGVIETTIGLLNNSMDDRESKRNIKRILKSCRVTRHRMNFLIKNIKLIGSIKNTNPITLSIKDLLDECLEEYRTEFGHQHQIFVSIHNDIKVTGSKSMLKCLVFNLINNAFQHGGIESRVEVVLSDRNLIIQDNGRGIQPSEIYRIFELFASSSSTNFGIGLALCREIINSHGGSINCISLPGSHSTFIVKFPQT